jgi:hypothetical protein
MNITPQNALAVEHQAWLAHPVTVQLIKNLDKQKITIVNAMSSTAGDNEIADFAFRLRAFGIKTIDEITKQIKNTEQFVQQSTK